MQALQWRAGSPRWGLIAPISSLQDSQRIKLGRPEPHHKFWTPRDIGASYFNATADSQLTITNPTRGSFVTLMSRIEG